MKAAGGTQYAGLEDTGELPKSNTKCQVCALVSGDSHTEDSSHIIEYGSANEMNEYITKRRTSLVILATAQINESLYGLSASEGADE